MEKLPQHSSENIQDDRSRKQLRNMVGAAMLAAMPTVGQADTSSYQDSEKYEMATSNNSHQVEVPDYRLAPAVSLRPQPRPIVNIKGNESTPESGVERESLDAEAIRRQYSNLAALKQAEFVLGADRVLLTDAENSVVGVLSFEDYDDMNGYLYTPGVIVDGLVRGGISREWVNKAASVQYPGFSFRGYRNSAWLLESAYESGPPALQQAIEQKEVNSYYDIVKFYADLPASEHDSRSRLQYIMDELHFPDSLPPVLVSEIKTLILGLCAHESGFKTTAISPRGARGIFQFMPATWADYNNDPTAIDNLPAQVEAAGLFFADLYTQVRHHIGATSMQKLLDLYDGNEERLLAELFPNFILSAYNAGAARVGQGVQSFLEHTPVENITTGSELFYEMADYMRRSESGLLSSYKNEAAQYVPTVRGYGQALRQSVPAQS